MAPSHAILSPSSAHRWMECTGSMAFAENHGDNDAGKYAAEGTAAHYVASEALRTGKVPGFWMGKTIYVAKKGGTLTVDEPMQDAYVFKVDDEMVDNVRVYWDEIWRRVVPKTTVMLVERRTNISSVVDHEGQFGTSDCVLIQPQFKVLEIHDFKYGRGEKVAAPWNHQMLLYAAGELEEHDLVYEINVVKVAIHQPRINHMDEFVISVEDLRKWVDSKKSACRDAVTATALTVSEVQQRGWLRPAEKTCRWCNGKARCPALAKYVQDAVRADFETIAAEPPPAPESHEDLERAIAAVPLIQDWCAAVVGETMAAVQRGERVLGTDGLPMKIVQGRQGSRKWTDELQAEAALVGQLGPEKAYHPAKILSASEAAKKLDKKATKALWTDVFVPLIARAPGKPQLALGSDERPPYTGAAGADEFDDENDEE